MSIHDHTDPAGEALPRRLHAVPDTAASTTAAGADTDHAAADPLAPTTQDRGPAAGSGPEAADRGQDRDPGEDQDRGRDLGGDHDDDSEDPDGDRSRQPVPVDPPADHKGPDLATRARIAQKRSSVLAPWLRDWQEFQAVARWLTGYLWHSMRFHAVRAPLYLARLTGRTPRGMLRVLRATGDWVFDGEARPLRSEAVKRADFDEYARLYRFRQDRVRLRLPLALAAVLGVCAAAAVVAAAGTAATVLVALAAVVVFGVLGAPADRPLLGHSVTTHKAPRLTSELVVRALAGLNIAQINAAVGPKGQGISFPAPIVRDGPGWRAEVDLPFGVTVPEVLDKRDKLASGLRRPLGCVWPEPVDDEHAGRLVLWVGDQPFRKTPPTPWPLTKSGQADMFRPFVFGTDQRGRSVELEMMFQSMLIGAMPRVGKTFSVRVPVSAGALDPTCELRLFEFKGTGDFDAYEPIAHHFGAGATDDVLAACMASLREVHGLLDSRAATLRKHRQLAPESKVTPELAAKRSLRLHPVLFAVDECQELFSHPQFKNEADELATAIVKRGPALGIMLALATQRPDAKSLPTGVSANVGVRLCLRVMGQTENDMVLGTSKYQQGVRATEFAFDDKGIGYLLGAVDRPDPLIARSCLIDVPAAERIAGRARELRQAAGTLSGHAIGEDTTGDQPAYSLLDDLITVTGADEDEVWSEIACARLAELRHDVYTITEVDPATGAPRSRPWEATALTAALKPHGVKTKQVWSTDPDTGEQRNRRGFVRAHILHARDNKKGGPSTLPIR